ncbi:MAG: hypothetical protein A2W52_03035 [Candidatus Taylorbacteria bacterium RIFCSPHIGHO2_02_49_25]|uniref:Uncharacterized protein n=1 Tax=Candidatus Taylorbacteria bacterium RIFCSPHIGHO2_02_49_25 TaxID=1802305 RepID=A0A1G2MEA3_9BACT|nr:MAG: hypothetical protein UY62_C0007G0002 [Parcubacteria group bacterium GW2011_GWF2_50_9]OHA19056.1 MAG: hypothetical protein A2759_02960 [Candidatus Taylorbacteria bacterium RIFCSPHIGHO2_01_FULL_49_60]OHA22226.1 MAG: hypothetical protein A2W52_03035 [Candidatus Taylorbacteria bacterium RIFCSPHIGHO2_02_49_25]OHA35171.1 MAG: hypothetical protein A3B27_01610 [Candidatus Taylorbacteria bacterium RIFCSPLOWO2_01_FULL_50_130]OHA36100.1 MAG: hypothetical protein A2W65_02010 [Candidatus Taylorbacte
MKFEKSFILEEGDALMKKALERAKAVIARDEIKIDDFVDLYGSERLSRDRRYVEQRERQFLERNSSETAKNAEWAKVFEAILHEHGEQSNWFGAEATTLKTSRYDDIINGVDELIEYQKEDSSLSFLALAVDATYSHETRGKLRRIKGEIDAGNLATIRYFAAENVDIKGELKNIPHVIVGTDRSTLLELSELWLQGKNGELAIHPIQFQILEEIISQCETFAAYAKKIGRTDIAEKYESAGRLIGEILKAKRSGIRDSGRRDSVFSSLKGDLSEFERI